MFQHVLLVGISFAIPGQGATEMPVLAVLAAGALGTAVASTQLDRLPTPAQTKFILRLALSEAASLFGFVSYMLSNQHTLQFACAGIGIVATALAFPKDVVDPAE